MATYAEIYEISSTNTELLNKVTVACLVAADQIRAESTGTANHDNRLIWAKETLENPPVAGKKLLPAVLVQNTGVSAAGIIGASDAAIQGAVNTAINLFATG